MSEAAARIIASEDPPLRMECQNSIPPITGMRLESHCPACSHVVMAHTPDGCALCGIAAYVVAALPAPGGAPGASTEPVIDRDGIRVYATAAGRYVAADRAGWAEGTFGTPEEAWAAGAPGE